MREQGALGERIQRLRAELGLSRSDFAGRIGVTQATLSRWEANRTRPSPLALGHLEILGLTNMASNESSTARLNPAIRKIVPSESEEQFTSCKPEFVVAPYVRNGPSDQNSFHEKLIHLQLESPLNRQLLGLRLSLVETSTEQRQQRHTAQNLLERPSPAALAWNSNYGSHGWHRYVGRFPPHLVRAVLNHFGADSASTVCDPFSGSGTTAVECRLLGINFIGVEICPLSAMMTRVKASFPPDASVLIEVAKQFQSFYQMKWESFVSRTPKKRGITHEGVIQREGNCISPFVNFEKWFTPDALLGTSIAVEFAMTLEGFQREALLTALSARMRSIGNVDVDVVRAEYSKKPRVGVDVGKMVYRQLLRMANDVSASVSSHVGVIGSKDSVHVLEGSALDVDIESSSVDFVLTSPPYGVEAISYLRTHLLSYRALTCHLKHDPYEKKEKTIGSEYLTDIDCKAGTRSFVASESFRSFFATISVRGDAKFNQRRAAMMQFCDDMLAIGERMHRWLRPNGRVAFVIGNKRLGDSVMPMDSIVVELFGSCGLELEDSIRHKLKTNNSNSQVPWQERIIQEESILFFRKAR